MFHSFIDTALNNPDCYTIFDKCIKIYSSQGTQIILEKMRDWNKEKHSK